jgi:hypothetical protein
VLLYREATTSGAEDNDGLHLRQHRSTTRGRSVAGFAVRALALVLLLASCGDGPPTGPSGISEGIILYEHPNFSGAFKVLTNNVSDLDDLELGCTKSAGAFVTDINWDDCVSSIRVAPGWSVTVYEDPRYHGDSSTFTSDVADLDEVRGPCDGSFDDCISSIRF